MKLVEKGVAVMLREKFWGELYVDGQSTANGWTTDPRKVMISDPKYFHSPEDMTYRGSWEVEELRKGKLVNIVRETTIEVVDP